MCLLSVYPPEVMPDEKMLTEAAKRNPHGFGFALVTVRASLITGRGMDASKVIAEFLEARDQNPAGAAMFHCRWATSGTRNVDNCHPFQVGRDRKTVLAHNGILFKPDTSEDRSDTHIFAAEIMPTSYRAFDRPAVRARLEKALGSSKVALLTINRRYRHPYYIFNEKEGHWHQEGSWQSNHTYEPRITTTYYYGGNNGGGAWENGPNGSRVWKPTPATPATTATVTTGGSRYTGCKFCHASQCVEPYTHICTMCKTCQDCNQWLRNCACALRAMAGLV